MADKNKDHKTTDSTAAAPEANKNNAANAQYSYFYSELTKSGTKDRSKRTKEAWRWIKYIIFGFLLITTLWGCVNGFTLRTSDQGGWGFEIYANWTSGAQDNIYPNAYQVTPTASARVSNIKEEKTPVDGVVDAGEEVRYVDAIDYTYTTTVSGVNPTTSAEFANVTQDQINGGTLNMDATSLIHAQDYYWYTSIPTVNINFANAIQAGISTTSAPVKYVNKGDTNSDGTIDVDGIDDIEGPNYGGVANNPLANPLDENYGGNDDEGWTLNYEFNVNVGPRSPDSYHDPAVYDPDEWSEHLTSESTLNMDDTDEDTSGEPTDFYKTYQDEKKIRTDNYYYYQMYSGVAMVGPETIIYNDKDKDGKHQSHEAVGVDDDGDGVTGEVEEWAYAWEFVDPTDAKGRTNALAANAGTAGPSIDNNPAITDLFFTGSTVKYEQMFVQSVPYLKNADTGEIVEVSDITNEQANKDLLFSSFIPEASPLFDGFQTDAEGNKYFANKFKMTMPTSTEGGIELKTFDYADTNSSSIAGGVDIAYQTAMILVPYNKDNRVNLSDEALEDTEAIRADQGHTGNQWVANSDSPRGEVDNNDSAVSQAGFALVENGANSDGDYVDDKGTYTTEDDEVLTEEDDQYFGGSYDLMQWNQFSPTDTTLDVNGIAGIQPDEEFAYYNNLYAFAGFLLADAADNHLNNNRHRNDVSGSDDIPNDNDDEDFKPAELTPATDPSGNGADQGQSYTATRAQFEAAFNGSWDVDNRIGKLFAYGFFMGDKKLAVEISLPSVGQFMTTAEANGSASTTDVAGFNESTQSFYALGVPQALVGVNQASGVNVISDPNGGTRSPESIAAYEGTTNIYSARHILANWNDAWTYGPFIAIFVYPIAMVSYAFNSLIPVWEFGGISVFLGILFVVILLRSLATAVSFKQTRQTQKMQEIQLKVASINAKYDKYGDNKDMKRRKQMETMALYKKEEINPLGSLAQIVVTMPLFLAIWKIISALPIYKMHNIGPISATVTPLAGIFAGGWALFAYLTLLLLVVGTQFVSFKLGQWLSQKRKGVKRMDDATKAQYKKNNRIANWMLVFYVIMSITIPSLLAIYWILSGSFSIGMTWVQHWITLSHAKKTKSKNKAVSVSQALTVQANATQAIKA